MAARILALFLLTVLALSAAKKNSATARGENEDLILNVTIYIDGEGAKEMIGDDLGGHYIVAQVKVEPKYGKDVTIDRDDFQLRTDRDGSDPGDHRSTVVPAMHCPVQNNDVARMQGHLALIEFQTDHTVQDDVKVGGR